LTYVYRFNCRPLFCGDFVPRVFALPSLATTQQLQQQQQQTTTTTTSSSPSPPPPSLSVTTTPPLTPEEQEQQNRLQNVIAATTADLNKTEKQVSEVVFTPRWSEPVWVNANSVAVLVAYCLPGEFADSGQEILGGFELEVLESYAIDLPQGFMVWMAVVGNEDLQNRRFPAALGVICASDLNDVQARVLSPQEQQQINNINQQFVNIQNTQITDIDNVINVINNVTTNATGGGMPPPPPPPTDDTGGGGGTPPIQCPIGSFYNSTSGQCERRFPFPDVIGNTTIQSTSPVLTVPTKDITINVVVVDPEDTVDTTIKYRVSAQDDVDGYAELDSSGILHQDDVGGDITISCDPPPTSRIPVGVTTVKCTAVDQAGNVGTTKSFNYNVVPIFPRTEEALVGEQPPPTADVVEEAAPPPTADVVEEAAPPPTEPQPEPEQPPELEQEAGDGDGGGEEGEE
jgi:hypothetical protein